MKKVGIILLCIICFMIVIILLSDNKNEMVCTSISDQKVLGYKIENTYNILSDKGIVNKIIIKEVVTSKDDNILQNFEKQYRQQYDYNKNMYGGYSYKISNKKNKLIVNVSVNYEKVNLEKFINDNEAMKGYTENNKITLDGIKKLYESTGAKCS